MRRTHRIFFFFLRSSFNNIFSVRSLTNTIIIIIIYYLCVSDLSRCSRITERAREREKKVNEKKMKLEMKKKKKCKGRE